MSELETFEKMQQHIRSWPSDPPDAVKQNPDLLLLYRAAKEAADSPCIVEAQKHLYCKHAMSFMLRPVFDTVFGAVSNAVDRS